jgi:signal transduction histidine kinase
MIKQPNLHDTLDFIKARIDQSDQIALVTLDHGLRIEDYNRGFAYVIERSENLEGVDLKTLLLPESREYLAANFVEKSVQLQLHFILPGGGSKPLQCWFNSTAAGALLYAEQALMADSEAMRTVSLLNNQLAGLTRELNRKNRALQQVQSQLQLKNEEIEHFVSIVAHDFNSPLITITLFAAMLKNDISSGASEKVDKDLGYINQAATKLTQLLGALKKITDVGKSTDSFQTIRFTELVDTCLATLTGPLQQHNVKVIFQRAPLSLTGDPLELGQIWQNLIENAVKYRGDHPSPTIEIGFNDSQDEAEFYVRDNGIGISPEHAQRVFMLFTQLNKSNPGSGLGLALVKKIVERQRGKIWVESAGKGRGSCFYFTLPDSTANKKPTT